MHTSHYDLFPTIQVQGYETSCVCGWEAIAIQLQHSLAQTQKQQNASICIECYTGVDVLHLQKELQKNLAVDICLNSEQALREETYINTLSQPFLGGDDPIFGWLSNLRLPQLFAEDKVQDLRKQLQSDGIKLIVGLGASHICPHPDILIYADMPRWEGQLRYRRNEAANIGTNNHTTAAHLQYKRAFFNDWRICDQWKKGLIAKWDFVLDTVHNDTPKLVTGDAVRAGLEQAVTQPFRVVPFFDPAPWGGQWMKEYCGLNPEADNYGWCFDCVPEENSLLLQFGADTIEIPSINLVFDQSVPLLGEHVHARFGDEFPIRFDFLDTMAGGHLSFQVHPLTEYIQNHFGMHYTQDESYYILDCGDDATVYLGTKTGASPDDMRADLEAAQRGEKRFDDERFVNQWPAKKHDHFLIPAGTCHCSGANSMVLEISATPYIFTFKMWDWDRLGLDGKPRPINIDRGMDNVDFSRDTEWTQEHLINQFEAINEGTGWREERTGLHEREFIETRRHWFTETVPHNTDGGVHVLNLVEGAEIIVESPTQAFAPFIVHYAETFIVPAAIGAYTIRPYGPSIGQECATMKAFVRTTLPRK